MIDLYFEEFGISPMEGEDRRLDIFFLEILEATVSWHTNAYQIVDC